MNNGILIVMGALFTLSGCGSSDSSSGTITEKVVLDTLKNDGLSTNIPDNAPSNTIGVIDFDIEGQDRDIFVTFNNDIAQGLEQKLISTSDASFYDVVNYYATDEKNTIKAQLELVQKGMATNAIILKNTINVSDLPDNIKNINFIQKTSYALDTAIVIYSENNTSQSINSILPIDFSGTSYNMKVDVKEDGDYDIYVKGLLLAEFSNSLENNITDNNSTDSNTTDNNTTDSNLTTS